jgi:hypothetical protein
MKRKGVLVVAVLCTAFVFLFVVACEDNGALPPDEEIPEYLPNTDESYWTYSYQRYQNNVPLGEPFLVTDTFDGSTVIGDEAVQNLVRTVEGELPYQVFLFRDNDINTYTMFGREYYDGSRDMTGSVYFDPVWLWAQYPLSVGTNWQVVNVTGISPLAIGLPADIDNDGRDDTVDVEVNCSTVVKGDVTTEIGIFTDAYKVRRNLYVTYYLTQGGESKIDFEQYFWFKPEKGTVKMSGDEIAYPNGPRYTFEASLSDYDIKPEPE